MRVNFQTFCPIEFTNYNDTIGLKYVITILHLYKSLYLRLTTRFTIKSYALLTYSSISFHIANFLPINPELFCTGMIPQDQGWRQGRAREP